MFLTDNWKKINTDPVCFGTKNDGQDLVNYTELNNAGETCADVYALYP